MPPWSAAGRWATSARVYTWPPRGRQVPVFGIVLLVLGVGLLVTLLIPDLSFGSLLIFALGVAAAAAWLVGGVTVATVPALVLLGWGLASIGSDLGYLVGDGWGSLFIGAGLLVAWALGRSQRVRREWAFVVGIVLGAIGLAEVADTLPFDADLAVLIPLAMVAVGVYLIARDRLPARG